VAAVLLTVAGALPVAAAPCGQPPQPVRNLDLPRFYGDAEGSRVDPELAGQHKAAVAPLTEFLRHVVAEADKAAGSGHAATARCALHWIAAWAKGEAWLGQMGTRQAEYQRKWDLAGIALAYVKIRRFATPAQRGTIEPWLIRFADTAKAFQLDASRRRNNHLYWLGLGLAATAIAADSPRHWEDARAIMDEALSHIQPDGTLPLELTRGARALHYHAFAVTPLVVMAELAEWRGQSWYALADGALHRLVARTAVGLVDPTLFDVLARTPQERPAGTGAGWLALYVQRFPDRLPSPLPEVPEKHRWLGGNVRTLAKAIASTSRDPAARRLTTNN